MSLFSNARLLMKLSPYMDKIGKQLPMSKNVHGSIQLLLTIGQALNAVLSLVPDKEKIYVAVGISAVQGIIGILNHFDGDGATATDTTSTSTSTGEK